MIRVGWRQHCPLSQEGNDVEEICPGIYRWTAPHPEYRPRAEEVVAYALVADDVLALVDPLLPANDDKRRAPVLAGLDRLAGAARRLEILITIPYHTRSAESLLARYARTLPTRIWGHANVARRLSSGTPLSVIAQGTSGSGAAVADRVATAFTIGNPRRTEFPLYFPSLKALAFGDAVVGTAGGLRIWRQSPAGPQWFRDRFVPTLRPLLELDVERVLVTHGPTILEGGRRALAEALAAAPVDMY
jgi:hypothetical protein